MNNKKGVKLLAAIMAFAMVLVAGFAIVGVSDDSDADVGAESSITSTPVPEGGVLETTGVHIIKTNTTVTLPNDTISSLALYVIPGVTVTINGGGSNTSGDIVIYTADSTGAYTITNDVNVTITDLKAGSINIKTITYGIPTDGAGTATFSTMEVSGNAIEVSTIASSEDGQVSIGSAALQIKNGAALTSIPYGIKTVSGTTSVNKYYSEGANIGSFELKNGYTISILNGSAIVSQDGNVVNLKNVKSTDFMITGGDSTYPAITGTTTSGEISISNGYFIVTAEPSNVTGNFVHLDGTTSDYISNKVVSSVGSDSITATKITGKITQNANLGVSGTPTSNAITVNPGSTYVVSEGIEIYVTSLTATGEARIFGSVTATVSGNNVFIGPVGYVSSGTNLKNTNVTSGIDSYIGGSSIISEVTDAILADDLRIAAGTTVTVTGNLGLNGHKIIVDGTLVVKSGAIVFGTGVTAESIVLGTKGVIDNNGTIGSLMGVTVADKETGATQTIKLTGVSGAQFGYKKVGSTTLALSGEIAKISAAKTGSIVIDDAAVYGDLTIGKNVTLDLKSTNGTTIPTYKGSSIVVDGTLKTLDSTILTIGEQSSITVNGKMMNTVKIVVEDGSYDSKTGEYTVAESGLLSIGIDYDDGDNAKKGTYTTGFTAYNERVSTVDENDEVIFVLKAFLEGAFAPAMSDEETPESIGTTVKLENDFTVAEGKTLTVKKDVNLVKEAAGFTADVQGTIVVEQGATISDLTYIGAYYTVTTKINNADVVTRYYTSLAAAMDVIESADDKKVTTSVTEVDSDVTVGNGQTLVVDGITIDESSVVTVLTGGKINGGITEVLGKLVKESGATVTEPDAYASKKTSENGTITYAGFVIALGDAAAGDIITVENAQVDESLTIKAGVKVIVNGVLQIKGNLTVPETAELVGGTIIVKGTDSKTAEVKVAGTMDLSEGSLSGEYNTLTSTGTVILVSKYNGMNGAYYYKDSNVYLTTIAKAVESGNAVYITGKVTETSDITMNGKDLTIDADAQVTLGTITLKDAKVISNGDLTAKITGLSGKDADAVDSTVSVVKSTLTVESKKTTSAAGVTTYVLSVDAIDGTVQVTKGVVTVTATNASEKSRFIVDSGAEAVMSETATLAGDNVEVIINGTLSVAEGKTLTFSAVTNGKVAVVAGDLKVGKDATVEIYAMNLTGNIDVINTTDATGSLVIKGSKLTLGAPITSIGAAGSITGPVTLDNGQYIIAYPGSDLSAAIINVPAGGESTAVSSKFFVNDVLYATVYAQGDVKLYDSGSNVIITKTILDKIDGVDNVSSNNFLWKDVDGNDVVATDVAIGDEDAFYYTLSVSEITIDISVGTGISLWIDGVKKTGDSVPLTIGEHQVSATVDPGYKGTITIVLNGVTISNGKLVVTSDMKDQTNVLSATGDITIDTGSTPEQKDDSGMGITDYLLIVLVVLAAILVVIVAIRMMRS